MAGSPARVVFPFAGAELGGSHISTIGLIKNLDRSRFTPVVVVQFDHGPLADYLCAEGVRFEVSPETPSLAVHQPVGPREVGKAVRSVPVLTKYLRNLGAEIVHCNDGRSAALWATPAKLAGALLVWHNRGNPAAKGLRYVAPFLADKVVSVSNFASPAPGLVSAARINEVVYSPFDTGVTVDRAQARAALIGELGVAEDTRIVGYSGLLIERKRPLVFVEALAHAIKADDRFYGVMFGVGDDQMVARIEEKIETLDVRDRVRLMGFRKPGSTWIGACDALLVPAIEEPFGRTLIEAMLVRTPIVATRSGGNPEAIAHDETGVLVEPENPRAQADALVELFNDRARINRLTDAARTDALERFGDEKHAQQIMGIYDTLLKKAA